MYYTFTVRFSNNHQIEIKDINKFDNEQIIEVRRIALKWRQEHLKAQKYGIDLETVEEKHKNAVLDKKDTIVQAFSASELFDKKIIKITTHSLDQTLKRVGSIGRKTFIDLIERLKVTDTVKKIQWKGYNHLSYTLTQVGDSERYEFALSFYLYQSGKDEIKLITVIKMPDEDKEPERMQHRILDDDKFSEIFAKMEELYKKP
ncbi:hypothetical protein ACQKGA_28265 [Priestia megaterium]|uniref:hypothetical protein n=1 Tax=Priestia megaterium TaxID=1404 RepID=UPI003D064D11